MNEHKTVPEIAEMYNVHRQAVYLWLRKGLPFKVEKVVGIKPRKVILPADVDEFLKIGIR